MEHPRLFAGDDPFVVRMRSLCLRYPESSEAIAWGRPAFRAGRKTFAFIGSSIKRPNSLVFRPEPDARRAYNEDPRFFFPPYWGPDGWLGIDLDQPETDWGEIAELIDASYRQVCLKRQLAALDAHPLVEPSVR